MGEQQRRNQQAGDDDVVRGRPGRRSLEDRQAAVLELLGGKATVDQLARRYGVKSETIEAWRDEAMAGISEALRRGPGKSSKELELERENKVLKDALTRQVMKTELLERALEARPPTLPGKSRR
jgi:transposase-like protein